MWTLQVTFKKHFFFHKPCKKYAGQEKCFFLKQDPDPGSGFKILICRVRIRPKMYRIRNPAHQVIILHNP